MAYHDEVKYKLTIKLRDILNGLPNFCREFFLSIADSSEVQTRVAYAYDLRIFFNFLIEECKEFEDN